MGKPIFTRGFKQPEKPTDNQLDLIEKLEYQTGFEFNGTTKHEASEFISMCLKDLRDDEEDDREY